MSAKARDPLPAAVRGRRRAVAAPHAARDGRTRCATTHAVSPVRSAGS